MGNSAQKQKKKENLEIFKTLKNNVITSQDWNDTIKIIISYWARNSCLNSIAFQHVTSIMIISAIQAFARQHFAAQMAKKILSIHKLNDTEFNQYTQEKFESLQTFISKENILRLCEEIEPILAKDEILFKLNLKPDSDQKLIIFGDIRGDLLSLLKHFDAIRNDTKTQHMNIIDKILEFNDIYLFLGSYVCRGECSIECICLLYCLKLMFPNNIYLLRGFQEATYMNRIYGFYDELKKCYPKINGQRASGIYMWKRINETFNWMPFAAVINNRWFAVHSGISPELKQLDMYHMLCIHKYNRPVDVGDTGLLCDLLWCDPEHIVGWGEQDGRGVSYVFGPDVLEKFLKKNNLDMFVRAHQVVQDGFEWFVENKLVTLFSTVDYCGEFDNDGAIMIVDSDLKFEFSVVKSTNKE